MNCLGGPDTDRKEILIKARAVVLYISINTVVPEVVEKLPPFAHQSHNRTAIEICAHSICVAGWSIFARIRNTSDTPRN